MLAIPYWDARFPTSSFSPVDIDVVCWSKCCCRHGNKTNHQGQGQHHGEHQTGGTCRPHIDSVELQGRDTFKKGNSNHHEINSTLRLPRRDKPLIHVTTIGLIYLELINSWQSFELDAEYCSCFYRQSPTQKMQPTVNFYLILYNFHSKALL